MIKGMTEEGIRGDEEVREKKGEDRVEMERRRVEGEIEISRIHEMKNSRIISRQ